MSVEATKDGPCDLSSVPPDVPSESLKTLPEVDKLPGEGVASGDAVMEAREDKPCDLSSVPAEVAADPVVHKVPADAKDPKVSSECPSAVVDSAAEVESGVDKNSSDEVKMSVEATKDEPVNLTLVHPEVATDPVVRASHTEVDKLAGEGVPSGDDVSPEVVPSQEKLPEKASDPKSSCVSPALVSAVEGATGVPKKELSEDEFSPLMIASLDSPGEFKSVDDVLNEVRQLREQVHEGERAKDELRGSFEGKLNEVKTENELLKLNADELREKYHVIEVELKAFKLGFNEQCRLSGTLEEEVSQLKGQLQEKDDHLFESRTLVSGLVRAVDSCETAGCQIPGNWPTLSKF